MTTAGDAGGTGSLTGFYFREARFLSTVRLEIDGERLWLCEAASISPNQLQFVYTYPEVAVYEGGGSGQAGDEEPRNPQGIPQRGIDVTVTYRVGLDRLSATAVLGNRTRDALTFELSWILEADFADIQEAQAGRREQEAVVDIQPAGNEITFAYQHNDLPYVGARVFDGRRLAGRATRRRDRSRPAARSNLAPRIRSARDPRGWRRDGGRQGTDRVSRAMAQQLHQDSIAAQRPG